MKAGHASMFCLTSDWDHRFIISVPNVCVDNLLKRK